MKSRTWTVPPLHNAALHIVNTGSRYADEPDHDSHVHVQITKILKEDVTFNPRSSKDKLGLDDFSLDKVWAIVEARGLAKEDG